MSDLSDSDRELALIAIGWLRGVERATGEAAARLGAMIDDIVDEPVPSVRGAWQRKIAPLAGFARELGLTAGEVAREADYDEANTYAVLAGLEKGGLLEEIPETSPKRWRLAEKHRRNMILRASHVIREGEWTTYGDIAAAVSGNVNQSRSVARIASTNPAFANPHRVLNVGGRINPDWHDDQGRGPEECERRLTEEGIRFVEGKAQAGRIDYDTIKQRLAGNGENEAQRGKRNMSLKASDIDDPMTLIDRVAYRTSRLLDRIDQKDDPAAFVRLMAGHDRTDLRRALELMAATADGPVI